MEKLLEPPLMAIQHTFLSADHLEHSFNQPPRPLTPDKLLSFTPPSTSPRIWISLLQRAIIGVGKGAVFKPEYLHALTSLLDLPSATQVPALEGLLLAAYVCHATRVKDGSIADHEDLQKALFKEDALIQYRVGSHSTFTAVGQYRSQICANLLVHLSSNSSGPAPSRKMLEELDQVLDVLLEMMTSTLRTSLFMVNRGHPLLGLLKGLLPTPKTVRILIKRLAKEPSTLIRDFATLGKLCQLLFYIVQPLQIADIFMDNDCLRAFGLVTKRSAKLPAAFLDGSTFDELILGALARYIGTAVRLEPGPRLKEHSRYIYRRLEAICVCVIIWGKDYETAGFLTSTLVHEVVSLCPQDPIWDAIPAKLLASPLLAKDGQRLTRFLNHLTHCRRLLRLGFEKP